MRLIGLVVVLTLGLVIVPLVPKAQTVWQVPRIGILETGSLSARGGNWPAFHQRCVNWATPRGRASPS